MNLPDWLQSDVQPGDPFPELTSFVQDAVKAWVAASEHARSGEWHLVKFDLMLLELAAEAITTRCLVEADALHDPTEGAF